MTRFSVEEGGDMQVEEEEEEEICSKKRKYPSPSSRGFVLDACEESWVDNSTSITVKIDPDVLDCSICYEPLQPPLLQCQFGHVACSSCFAKLSNKCHVCSHPIIYTRCLALEKVIESIKSRCSHGRYGCKSFFSYSQRQAHEETCAYAPCDCPIENCAFRGSATMLSCHISTEHRYHDVRYDHPLSVAFLPRTDPFLLLRGEDGHLFILVNNDDEPRGRILFVACIRPTTLHCDFTYQLTISKDQSFLQFKAPTTNIKNLNSGCNPPKLFLMLPLHFGATGEIALDVCIRKVKCSLVK